MSSVNEGKFRVLSDSMIAAFHGAPEEHAARQYRRKRAGQRRRQAGRGVADRADENQGAKDLRPMTARRGIPRSPGRRTLRGLPGALIRMERQVQNAMQALIDAKLVTVRRESMWLEIEINTDILFRAARGVRAASRAGARQAGRRAQTLSESRSASRDTPTIGRSKRPFTRRTGNSRGARGERRARIHQGGIDPLRLEIVGFGEFHPRQTNDTVEGPQRQPPGVDPGARGGGAGRPGHRANFRTATGGRRPGDGGGGCVGCDKSATMACAARGCGQDSAGQGSCADGRRADGRRAARRTGGDPGAGTAVEPGALANEVSHS
jgi:chemotaxis protein MotB